MKNKTLIFIMVFLLIFSIFCYAENNLSGNNCLNTSTELLSMVEVDGYQISFFGFQGNKPGFFQKLLPPKRVRKFDIMIDVEEVKIFSYQQLDAMVEKAKDELKELYTHGARLKIVVIKEKKK